MLSDLWSYCLQCAAGTPKPYFTAVLGHFLKFVFDFLLLSTFESGLLDLAAECLFVLVCCDSRLFVQHMQSMVQQQATQQTSERLNAAFASLVEEHGIVLVPDRHNRALFVKHFGHLLSEVRHFLLVK